MKIPRVRHFWFKLSIGTGALLGALLLAESVISYYHASTTLVSSELRREAQQQLTSWESEARRRDVSDPGENPADITPILEEMRQVNPGKIAWIKVIDSTSRPLAQSGA